MNHVLAAAARNIKNAAVVNKYRKMIQISKNIIIQDDEIECNAIRSQGSGGQNVNKVSTAIHLRFNIKASSLPDIYKERLLQLNDNRITKDGIIILKVQESRSQKKNKDLAILKLQKIIKSVLANKKKRKPTKPSQNSEKLRLQKKLRKGEIKKLRKNIFE
jgi:ribosome-associated protein